MVSARAVRLLPLGCAVAAVQMIVFVTVAGWLRPGYDSSRNWVSQLSLGPGGWLNDLNLTLCGIWLLAGAEGLRRTRGDTGGEGLRGLRADTCSGDRRRKVAAVLVGWCGISMVVLAALPTDAGIGYPPGVAPTHTVIGLVHQIVAITLGVAGIGAAALLGRPAVACSVAAIMTVSFTAASILVVLDASDVLPGNPSGLFERVALFLGLGWTAMASAREVCVRGRVEAIEGTVTAATPRAPQTTDAPAERADRR